MKVPMILGFQMISDIFINSCSQIWDDGLAEMAKDWVELCKWERGNVDKTYNHGFSNTGQNLYATTKLTGNPRMCHFNILTKPFFLDSLCLFKILLLE